MTSKEFRELLSVCREWCHTLRVVYRMSRIPASFEKLIDALRHKRMMPAHVEWCEQTLRGDMSDPAKLGNCYPACISMLTGIPLDEIPHFYALAETEGRPALAIADAWFKEQGFVRIELLPENLAKVAPHAPALLHFVELPGIIVGDSPTRPGEHNHCQVGFLMETQDGFGPKAVYDPLVLPGDPVKTVSAVSVIEFILPRPPAFLPQTKRRSV